MGTIAQCVSNDDTIVCDGLSYIDIPLYSLPSIGLGNGLAVDLGGRVRHLEGDAVYRTK